jgi:D-specific alpha-keto acid dehydrogenase
MTTNGPVRTATCRSRWPSTSPSPAPPTTGLTVYGCGPVEAALFRELAPRWGVRPVITAAPVSDLNVALARGNRCISVGHKTVVTHSTLRALSRAGVEHISTRSIGFDHLDVAYAESVGLSVGNVAYSPDSVADYTLMLMLMAIRHARSVLRRVDTHDYRLGVAPGKELRDLTVGVVGTGRIGSAVIDRLHGFGCRVLAHDKRAATGVGQTPLDELLRRSDIVSLHTPLDADSHHLLDRPRLALMRPGAVVVNTGRGALIDTEALVSALERGRLGGAALDVLEGEDGIFYADCSDRPVAHDLLLRLHRLPNVLISPHTAFYTDHALTDIVENSLSSCVQHDRGRRDG